MADINQTIKRLLFISDEICEIFDKLAELSMMNLEKSLEFDKLIEFLDSYHSQENLLLDNLNKNELQRAIANLYAIPQNDPAIQRCYVNIKNYYEIKYPEEIYSITQIENTNEDEYGNIEDVYSNIEELDTDYEDDDEVYRYHNYVILKTAISAIKKMYKHIQNTEANNKTDYKYKKALLKHFKIFKYNFFSINKDAEMLGIKYRFNVDELPEMAPLDKDVSSIYYNECIDILDNFYRTKDSERNIEIISETLFDMLCFDEYIKELSIEQIDKLINICRNIEDNNRNNYFGNIGLQKLVRTKKN